MSKVQDLLDLKDKVNAVKTELDKATGKLEAAVASATEEFGTPDVKKLKKMLEEKAKVGERLDANIEKLEMKINELLDEIEGEEEDVDE